MLSLDRGWILNQYNYLDQLGENGDFSYSYLLAQQIVSALSDASAMTQPKFQNTSGADFRVFPEPLSCSRAVINLLVVVRYSWLEHSDKMNIIFVSVQNLNESLLEDSTY